MNFRNLAVHLSLVALITAAALALRLCGVGFLLPQMTESDGRVIHEQVLHLERGDEHPERDRSFGFYPLLIARVTALAFDHDPVLEPATSLEEHLRRAAISHVRVRIVGAILSVLIVPATWLLARSLLAEGMALLAAAFMATSTLHLWFAQQGRPHSAAAAFGLIAILSALRLRRSGRPIDVLAAGLALGLAVGSLESGVATIPAFAAALFLREGGVRRAAIGWYGLALAILGFCVWYFYPFLFAPSTGRDAATLAVQGKTMNLFGHLIFLDQFRGAGFVKMVAALRDYEPWIAALAMLGLALALSTAARKLPERWKDLVVVLSHALPYALLACLYARTYPRFATPLLPYLCVLAAYAVSRISARLPAAQTAVPLVLLAPQAWLAVRLDHARRAPDTIEETARWISANIPPGDEPVLVLPSLEIPLPDTDASLAAKAPMFDDANRPWLWYQYRLAPEDRPRPQWNFVSMPMVTDSDRAAIARDPATYLRGLRSQWAVIEVYGPGRKPAVLGSVRAGLEQIADRVARFVPDPVDEGQDLPLVYQDDEFARTSVWAWRTALARCVGPVMEVWRIRGP